MGLFKKIFKPKSPDSKRFRREMAEQMCGHHIRYVTEKRNGVDEVIGRNGGLNIRDDELWYLPARTSSSVAKLTTCRLGSCFPRTA